MTTHDRTDPFAEVINVLAAPIAGGIRSVEQFQRGIGELFRAVENLNTTLENLNETAMRVNRLVADVEEPIRAMMPQVTRTIKAADEITRVLHGPVRSTAPNLEKIVDTLSSPGFASLPTQLGQFMEVIGDVSRRLAPLTQFAENAGGLFGGFRLPGMPGSQASSGARATSAKPTAAPSAPRAQSERAPAAAARRAPEKVPASTSTGKKSTGKKSTGKKSTGKTSTGKQR